MVRSPSALATILGLDPGIARVGFAVAVVDLRKRSIQTVLDIGLLRTERSPVKTIRRTSDDFQRARFLARKFRKIIKSHDVFAAAVEMSSTTPYQPATLAFGITLGIIATWATPVVQVLPHETKFAATGNSKAKKSSVVRWAIEKMIKDDIEWPTVEKSNSLGIKLGGQYVAAWAEHQADALATIQAALDSDEFDLLSYRR